VTMNVSDDYEYLDEELQEIILGFFEENEGGKIMEIVIYAKDGV